MEWLLFGGFFAGILFPLHNVKKKYFLWIFLLWALVLIGLAIYSYFVWTPPPQVSKLAPFPQSPIDNAIMGFMLSLVMTFYFLWPYLVGFSIRVVFELVLKKAKGLRK